MSFEIFTPTPPVSNINAEYVVSPLYKDDPNVPVVNFPLTQITLFPDIIGGNEPVKPNTVLNVDTAAWFYYSGMLYNNFTDPNAYLELGPFYISNGGTYQLGINFRSYSGNNVILDVLVDGVFKTQINIPDVGDEINYLYRQSIGTLDTGFHTIKIKWISGFIEIYDSIFVLKTD